MTIQTVLSRAEDYLERSIFAVRWVLVPGYIVLAISLCILAYKSVGELFRFVASAGRLDETAVVAQTLSIVDLILVMNLVLMVIFVGYINFVSKIHPQKEEDRPQWMDTLDYSGLKVQLIGSIIAIASVKLLRLYIDIGDSTTMGAQRITWLIVIYLTLIGAILILAIVNRLKVHPPHAEEKLQPPSARPSDVPPVLARVQ
jgi:uncharacterized protein (TIGR00645 family)